LTKALYETGIDSDEAVAQAETQLDTTQAQDTGLGILRAQYEHAIAMLIGQPASTFSIPVEPLKNNPPAIPIGVPSQLLESHGASKCADRNCKGCILSHVDAQWIGRTREHLGRGLVYVAKPVLVRGAVACGDDL
jgi:hypothetical protein